MTGFCTRLMTGFGRNKGSIPELAGRPVTDPSRVSKVAPFTGHMMLLQRMRPLTGSQCFGRKLRQLRQFF